MVKRAKECLHKCTVLVKTERYTYRHYDHKKIVTVEFHKCSACSAIMYLKTEHMDRGVVMTKSEIEREGL